LKYWRGYIVAAILAAVTWALTAFSESHTALVDMVYPYLSRIIQDFLAQWSSGVDFCLWQVLAVLLGVLLLTTVVLMIVLKWNFVQWLGWVTATASALVMLHVGVYGLNYYAGPLSEDIRLNVTEYTVTELAEATTWYRDKANELALQIPRDEAGKPQYPSFEELAVTAADGFRTLTYEETLSVFSGATAPVKKLGWSDMYTSMGISGFTMSLTGEAAVNPDTPAVALPFTMCHEMCHRMCIAQERDANLGAYLACDANASPIFRYSGYFMALRYCYNALVSIGTTTADNAASAIYEGINPQLMGDLNDYNAYYAENQDEGATDFANNVNDAYIKANGDESGIRSYGEVADLLVSWYIQDVYLPAHKDEDESFDPLDKNQVDLTSATAGA